MSTPLALPFLIIVICALANSSSQEFLHTDKCNPIQSRMMYGLIWGGQQKSFYASFLCETVCTGFLSSVPSGNGVYMDNIFDSIIINALSGKKTKFPHSRL